MIKVLRPSIVLIISFYLLFSCQSESNKAVDKPIWTKEQSSELNKRLSFDENLKIKSYLKLREHWDVIETGSGLRLWIYEDVEGVEAKENDIVDVRFEIRLLNDSLLYSTSENELSNFKVDKSDIESGVMEGIKYMSEGDKAKMIIPSHLGHGLLGDFRKIPPIEVLLIDLELVKIY
ncbi:FKBP-type peptidyl-prolyl cis-trans isomerase [Brumimicrobium salinarum]|nr:FKBP-type peptidyl-prolyl cis-trans isomerase [Brumimicrobium salinarum]